MSGIPELIGSPVRQGSGRRRAGRREIRDPRRLQPAAAGIDVVELFPLEGHSMLPTQQDQEASYRQLLDKVDATFASSPDTRSHLWDC
jgi:hypothetical protein